MTIDSPREYFQIGKGTIWEGKNLYALYSEACSPWQWQPKLKESPTDVGLDCFSTPFDSTAVRFLEQMDVPAHKIASFESGHPPALRCRPDGQAPDHVDRHGHAGGMRKPWPQCAPAGNDELALLKSPAPTQPRPEEMNLRTIPEMAESSGVPVGLSDRTLGRTAPRQRWHSGACIVEKHFTLSRSQARAGQRFLVEPTNSRQMVESIRIVEKAIGKVRYGTNTRRRRVVCSAGRCSSSRTSRPARSSPKRMFGPSDPDTG